MQILVTLFHTRTLSEKIGHHRDSAEELSMSAFPRLIGFRHVGPNFWRMM
jgi:hypothetical protein